MADNDNDNLLPPINYKELPVRYVELTRDGTTLGEEPYKRMRVAVIGTIGPSALCVPLREYSRRSRVVDTVTVYSIPLNRLELGTESEDRDDR